MVRKSKELSMQMPFNSSINHGNSHSSLPLPRFSSPQGFFHPGPKALSAANSSALLVLRPALPPLPAHESPSSKDSSSISDHEGASQNPDIFINSISLPARRKSHSAEVHMLEKQEALGSRTQAWVQEHKASGKLVGEKLSSIQRKLRSFLTQSSKDVEKGASSQEDKFVSEPHDTWSSYSLNDLSMRPKSTLNMPLEAFSEEKKMAISPQACGTNPSISFRRSSNHNTHCLPSRHPFGTPADISEPEDCTDPNQLRDTCNKFFSHEQRTSWSNNLSPRNCYSNNIKSSYDCDKLVPKEVIGRTCNDKKIEIPSSDVTYDGRPFVGFENLQKSNAECQEAPCESQEARGYDESYFASKTPFFTEESKIDDFQINKVPDNSKTSLSLSFGTADCSDMNDLYKSSSESGRGTMPNSMFGSKSIVSPHSSGVSATSNLDTSLDSDHSTNETLWGHPNPDTEKKYVNPARHIYETPIPRQIVDKTDDYGDAPCESRPQFPSVAQAPSLPGTENATKLCRKQHKLSFSASALNSFNNPKDPHPKMSEISSAPVKKSDLRRISTGNPTNCRHPSEKSIWSSKGSSSSNRIGNLQDNCMLTKYSPSSRNPKNQIALPRVFDNAEPDLTSTTTGLDMESLLDEANDYSSDFSTTVSTLEPSEVNVIRKQLESLETMYSEILHLLGVKNSRKDNLLAGSFDVSHSCQQVNESLSSLTLHNSNCCRMHKFLDKRGFTEKRRLKSDCRLSSASKRLQRLESHVVTLARSVAHLSSEMRTQHVLVQELENMRQDVSWVQERMRLMQLTQGCHSGNRDDRNYQLAMPRDWDSFHKEVLELLNPSRAKKLTKFFGDEPPLIRQFLKRLGYEKYAGNFEAENIGIKELPYLTEEKMQKMGIPMGPRIRILQEANACCQQNQYKVYII